MVVRAMSGGRHMRLGPAEAPLAAEPASRERWFSTLVAHSSDLIAVLDDQARVMYANPAAQCILGFVPGTQRGRSLLELVHPDDRAATSKVFFESARRQGSRRSAVFRFQTASGSWRFLEASSTNCLDDPAIGGIVVNARDITEQKTAQERLQHSEQFLTAIADHMGEGMIATDHAGRVTFVNAAAEQLLGWGEGELIGKPGHETFHFLRADGSAHPREDCQMRGVFVGGEVVRADHDVFIRRDGSLVPVAYSASPLPSDDVRGALVLFNDITVREAERLRRERELEKLSWVGRIRDALDQDRFVLYSQPILDLATKAVVQNELLLRMVSPEGDIVEPDYFLATAEEFGLISEIDRWVVGETARLAGQGHPVEFNLSAKSAVDPDMLAIVRAAFETHGVAPELVVCELTETALVRDTPGAETFVRGLSDIGCKVALDDFGAGYCGFAYLKRLSVSFLKIDQQFVTDLANEASSRHVVSAVVNLARAFSMRTIAEGVEDDVTLEILKELGVDFAQGYFIAPPGPAADMLGCGVGGSGGSSLAG